MRKRFGNGFDFILILIFISSLLFLLLGLLPNYVSAKDAGLNQVLSIDAKSSTDSTEIIIKTKTDPAYADSQSEDPFRVVIDLPKANLKNVKKSISVNDSFIKDVKVTQLGEENDNLGRIEIILTKKLKYQVQKKGNTLSVSIAHQEDTAPAPAAATPAPSGDAVAEFPPATDSGAGILPLESAPALGAEGQAPNEISELPPVPLAESPEPPPPAESAPPVSTAVPATVPETIPEMIAPPITPEIAALPPIETAPPAPETAEAPATLEEIPPLDSDLPALPAPPEPEAAGPPAPEVAPVPEAVPALAEPEAAGPPAPEVAPVPEAVPAPAEPEVAGPPAPEVAPVPEAAPAPAEPEVAAVPPAPEFEPAPPVPVEALVAPEAAPAPAPLAPEVAPAPAEPEVAAAPPAPEFEPAPPVPVEALGAPEAAPAPAPPAPEAAPAPVPEVALAPAVVPPPPGGKRAIRKPLKVAAIPVNPPLQSAETISPQAETKRLAWISGNKIELAEPIKFLLNEAVILPESLPVVNDVLKVMQENPGIKIRVEGHTDDEGPARYNQELSEYRSIWIKIFLLARGITAERVQVFGFGKSRPVASNTTPVGREKNRRVELRIIGR